MQLMSWMVSRLGSRFSLVFEPHRRQVKHSALGRFLDQPTDLMVGLVDPDGVERVLPFTKRGMPLFCCEQFERINLLTFRVQRAQRVLPARRGPVHGSCFLPGDAYQRLRADALG